MKMKSNTHVFICLALVCWLAYAILSFIKVDQMSVLVRGSRNTLMAEQSGNTKHEEKRKSESESAQQWTLPDRLAEAVLIATSLKSTGSYMQLVCPPTHHLGDRPGDHTPNLVGSPCEAWQKRELAEVLWHVVDSDMVGLEWSSGSGTSWLLRRGMTMHSVEHCEPWLTDISAKLKNIGINASRWFPHHVARSDGNGCSQELENHWPTMEKIFGEYARYPREHLLSQYAPDGFDLVEVDGRFRDGCLVQAASLHNASEPMLLKPTYGMLLLDNSERAIYTKASQLPSHWLVVSFANNIGETTLWMSCPTKEDAACTRARRKIAQLMATVPNQSVGHWYKEHMARSKRDGVPGA